MNWLSPIDAKLLFSSGDKSDPRLGDFAKSGQIDEARKGSWHILGYPDDEGIRLNGGRPGSALAPDQIRKYLYKMTPYLESGSESVLDLGNLNSKVGTLESRHQAALEMALTVYKKGGNCLSLGGGHDYGFADAAAFCQSFQDNKPLVINFDAHLDVRPLDRGFTSGTPFRRLLEAFPKITFCEIGIQAQCNSQDHLSWLKSKGGLVLTYDEIQLGRSAIEVMSEFLLPLLNSSRPIFISLDLDAFSSAYAPGCSQSWPTGLTPDAVLTLLDIIKARGQVHGAGLYEVSPPLDVDDRTSRLAALLAHRLIKNVGVQP